MKGSKYHIFGEQRRKTEWEPQLKLIIKKLIEVTFPEWPFRNLSMTSKHSSAEAQNMCTDNVPKSIFIQPNWFNKLDSNNKFSFVSLLDDFSHSKESSFQHFDALWRRTNTHFSAFLNLARLLNIHTGTTRHDMPRVWCRKLKRCDWALISRLNCIKLIPTDRLESIVIFNSKF